MKFQDLLYAGDPHQLLGANYTLVTGGHTSPRGHGITEWTWAEMLGFIGRWGSRG